MRSCFSFFFQKRSACGINTGLCRSHSAPPQIFHSIKNLVGDVLSKETESDRFNSKKTHSLAEGALRSRISNGNGKSGSKAVKNAQTGYDPGVLNDPVERSVKFFCMLLWGFILFLPVHSLRAQDVGQAKLFYQQGMRALQENNLNQAEEDLKQASRLDPTHYEYHFQLSNIYAIRYDQSHQGKGASFYSKEAFFAAVGHLRQVVSLKPDFVPGHFNLGVLYKNQEEFERARECFKKVMKLLPQDTRAYLQIGETYERQGFFDEAREYYRKAQDINPMDSSVRNALEMLRVNEAKYEQSRKSRDQSSSLSRASSLFRQNAISSGGDESDPQGQGGGGSPSLTSLGMMLAQSVMNKRASQ